MWDHLITLTLCTCGPAKLGGVQRLRRPTRWPTPSVPSTLKLRESLGRRLTTHEYALQRSAHGQGTHCAWPRPSHKYSRDASWIKSSPAEGSTRAEQSWPSGCTTQSAVGEVGVSVTLRPTMAVLEGLCEAGTAEIHQLDFCLCVIFFCWPADAATLDLSPFLDRSHAETYPRPAKQLKLKRSRVSLALGPPGVKRSVFFSTRNLLEVALGAQ